MGAQEIRVRIKSRIWTVRLATAAELAATFGKQATISGVTLVTRRQILINQDLTPTEKLDTLIHEWLHAEGIDSDHRVVWRRARQLTEILLGFLAVKPRKPRKNGRKKRPHPAEGPNGAEED